MNTNSQITQLRRKKKPAHWGTSRVEKLSSNLTLMMDRMIDEKFPKESKNSKSIKKMHFVDDTPVHLRNNEPLPLRDCIFDRCNPDNIHRSISGVYSYRKIFGCI